jgi:hypothetical protein
MRKVSAGCFPAVSTERCTAGGYFLFVDETSSHVSRSSRIGLISIFIIPQFAINGSIPGNLKSGLKNA